MTVTSAAPQALIDACHAYLDAHAREARAAAAEDRAFVRYMNNPTTNTAGAARSTRSRTNKANHATVIAAIPVETAMNEHPWDLSDAGIACSRGDIFAFAMAITALAER